MKLRITILIVVFCCVSVDVHSQDYDEIVRRAFESIEQTSEDECAFTVVENSESGTRISQFDPRRTDVDQWKLMSIDGDPPSEDDIEDFAEEKSESDDSDDDDGFRAGFVEPGSLELQQETDTTYEFSFRPSVEDDSEDAKIMQHVDGTLRIDKAGNFVESMAMKSQKPFRPERGVKIKQFDLSMNFGRVAEVGPVVLQSVRAHVKGRAFLVIGFDEVEETLFIDHMCF